MKTYKYEINIAEKSLTVNGLEISWQEAGLTDEENEIEVSETIRERFAEDMHLQNSNVEILFT